MNSDRTAVSDVRPGTRSAVCPKGGTSNCVCAEPSGPDHGEEYVVSKKVAGKTAAAHLQPGPALVRSQRKGPPTGASPGPGAEHRRGQQVDLPNPADGRPGSRSAPGGDRGQTKRLFVALQSGFSAEVERLSQPAASQISNPSGKAAEPVDRELQVLTLLSGTYRYSA